MKAQTMLCEVYLNNQRYVYDDARKVFRSSSGLAPRAVTMEQVRNGFLHAGLAPAYVVAGVPYIFDEAHDRLVRMLEPDKWIGVDECRALIGIGAVTVPKGSAFKEIVDRETARMRDKERGR